MEIQPHTLPRPKGLIECDVVLDIGAGIRPMQWYTPTHHICVEPFRPYCEVLEGAGYKVWPFIAEVALDGVLGRIDLEVGAIYLLDVIEHMPKSVGYRVLRLATALACTQVVVYTPHGFIKQTKDVWGMGGDSWQIHRSGWRPEDFSNLPPKDFLDPGWSIQNYQPRPDVPAEGFYALWQPSTPK